MRRLLLSIAVFLAVHAAPLQAQGSLDGRTYSVEIARKGTKAKVGADELVFAGGTFRSTAREALGFAATPYVASGDTATTTFTAEAKSAKQGVMGWKGTVLGDTVAGEMTWHRTRRTPVRFWFKGTLKK